MGWLSRNDFSTRRGHAGPRVETPGAQMMGRHTFEYSLIPHGGAWPDGFRQAYAFATPLRAVSTGLHSGALPPQAALLQTVLEAFVVSAIKAAEAGPGWIVRG